jgi:polysaccharide export outer membrane protein
MLVRIAGTLKWSAIALMFAAALVSASGQETAKTNSPAADTKQPAKPTQAATTSSSSSGSNQSYVIGESDILDISVWKDKEVSRTIPVRPDGKISLPLIGEIQASGMTPLQLQNDITQRLKSFLANPEVTVIVTDPRSHHFNIMGQVAKPGTYPLSQSMTVLDAISLAGGFRDFAKATKVYVLRTMPDGTKVRLPFNYKEAIKGNKPEKNVVLSAGDTIVVP